MRHNYQTRFAEIDLITCTQNGSIHFTEVRAWKDQPLVHPTESITFAKRRKMRSAAQSFLCEFDSVLRKRKEFSTASEDPDLDAALTTPISDEHPLSFNLLWIRSDGRVEFFEAIF